MTNQLYGQRASDSIVVRPQGDSARLTPNFKVQEFACPCDRDACSIVVVHWALVSVLQLIRNRVGPVVIRSGYRCPSHNAEINGAGDSLHICGMAADISAELRPEELASVADAAGAGGIGVYPRHVHVDVGELRFWEGDYD